MEIANGMDDNRILYEKRFFSHKEMKPSIPSLCLPKEKCQKMFQLFFCFHFLLLLLVYIYTLFVRILNLYIYKLLQINWYTQLYNAFPSEGNSNQKTNQNEMKYPNKWDHYLASSLYENISNQRVIFVHRGKFEIWSDFLGHQATFALCNINVAASF